MLKFLFTWPEITPSLSYSRLASRKLAAALSMLQRRRKCNRVDAAKPRAETPETQAMGQRTNLAVATAVSYVRLPVAASLQHPWPAPLIGRFCVRRAA